MIFAITVTALVILFRHSIAYRISSYSNSSVKYSPRTIKTIPSGAHVLDEPAYRFLQDIVPNGTDGNETWILVENCEPDFDPPEPYTTAECVFLALIFGIMIVIMIVGNILVILAITMEKELQRPQYYLVCSLAVADLMVGIVVSPLAALYDINRQWHLGVPMCDFWNLSDVLACTASILHLVAIALDRYWSITDVAYMQKRTATRIGYMILVVWTISCGVSVAPMLGWKDSQFHCRVEVRNECLISQDPSYQIFSTTTAFYGPLVLICILYWKIYKAAKKRIQMQVKRRSNTNVAHIRAKILASQQQQQLQELTQDGFSSKAHGEGEVDEDPTVCQLDNGHGPPAANDRHWFKKDSFHQKQINVEIRLIQPSSAEATAAESDMQSGLHRESVRNVSSHSVANSIQQLGEIEDEREDNTANTHQSCARTESETTDSQLYSEAVATAATVTLLSQKCNGTSTTVRKVPTKGGSIVTGPGGSVDFSTEDEAEYMDGCPPAPQTKREPRRDSLSPAARRSKPPGATSHRRHSSFKALSPNLPRYSTVSQSEVTSTTCAYPTPSLTAPSTKKSRCKPKKETAEASRERRAGRTLAIITGIFVVSWLPFFILAVIRPLCGSACAIPKPLESVCLWLGYVNSAINPVVYTIFSPDFRNAFKKTLRKFCLPGRHRHSSF